MPKTAKEHPHTLIERSKIVKEIAKSSVQMVREKTKSRYDEEAKLHNSDLVAGNVTIHESAKGPISKIAC